MCDVWSESDKYWRVSMCMNVWFYNSHENTTLRSYWLVRIVEPCMHKETRQYLSLSLHTSHTTVCWNSPHFSSVTDHPVNQAYRFIVNIFQNKLKSSYAKPELVRVSVCKKLSPPCHQIRLVLPVAQLCTCQVVARLGVIMYGLGNFNHFRQASTKTNRVQMRRPKSVRTNLRK